MTVEFEWTPDVDGCMMCDCCTAEEQERAEVLTCVAKINGKVYESLSSICGIPVVTDEYRREVEDELREEALIHRLADEHQNGRVLWARI